MSSNNILLIVLFPIFIVLPQMLDAITTIHHDKPEGSRIAQMAKKQMKDNNNDNNKEQQLVPSFNITKLSNERQKRLLPYINYYRNNYQPQQQNYEYLTTTTNHHGQFTPFLDSNAIPGPFIPMVKTNKYYDYEYETIQQPTRQQQQQQQQQQEPPPNYSVIYDKLAQLKLIQQSHRYNIPIQQQQQKPKQKNQNYIPIYNYGNQRYKILASLPPLPPPPPPTQSPLIKTIFHTYTPTQIDLTNNNNYYYYKTHPNKEKIIYDFYQTNLSPQRFVVGGDGGGDDKKIIKKPIIIIDDDKSIVTRPLKVVKPQVIVENNYVAQKYIQQQQQQQPQEIEEEEEQIYYQTTPTNLPQEPTATKTNTLSVILKQLQDTNALPHTLTPDNIDNSIRTLVKILNNLKKQQQQPTTTKVPEIVVVDHNDDDDIYNKNKDVIVPGTIIQQFPANTIDGGTPGRPGIDYPALSTIPQTDFNCKLQRYKGFFADTKTNCQVWHYCDLNGGQASFLCPNGTIFSQVALTCDWWYNVKCSSTPQLYVLNERLYKYILPYSPKFPEDYSGPLVDKYLALKFQEMEEKMKKERKGKPKKDEEKQEVDTTEDDKDDSDQLRELQAKQIEET